jgi:hypothetical protein
MHVSVRELPRLPARPFRLNPCSLTRLLVQSPTLVRRQVGRQLALELSHERRFASAVLLRSLAALCVLHHGGGLLGLKLRKAQRGIRKRRLQQVQHLLHVKRHLVRQVLKPGSWPCDFEYVQRHTPQTRVDGRRRRLPESVLTSTTAASRVAPSGEWSGRAGWCASRD